MPDPNLGRSETSARRDMVLAASGSQLAEWLDMIDWYRRCLEDVADRRPVRGLTEAKLGYDTAMRKIQEAAL